MTMPQPDYRIPDPRAWAMDPQARQAQALERIADALEDRLQLDLAAIEDGDVIVGDVVGVAQSIKARRGW